MMAREDKVVQDLIKGIDFLLKKTVTRIVGTAQILGPKRLRLQRDSQRKF